MDDDQGPPPSSGDPSDSTSRRSVRGPTRLRWISHRRVNGEKITLTIDVHTGVATGPNSDIFSSYLGVLARDKISILTPTWEHVTEAEKNVLWQDVLEHFDIPNVKSLETRILSSIAVKWRQFKSMLTTTYIFGPKKGVNPSTKYQGIDDETWEQFVQAREHDHWQDVRRKAKEIQAHNVTPHILSRGGYKKLEENMMNQKLKDRAADGDGPVADPPSPPTRHEKWKQARLKRSGVYTSEESRVISEKIDSLVEESTQGTFTPQGREDILATAIGRPEHPGRVRAAGPGVGIRSFFGPVSRDSSSSATCNSEQVQQLRQELREEMRQEVRQEVKLEVRQELMAQFEQLKQELVNASQAAAPTQEPVAHTVRISTKGSCSPEGGPGDDMVSIIPCELYVEGTPSPLLVAKGKVFIGATTVHNMPLSPDTVKVTVENVIDGNARVPIQTLEVSIVAQACQTFIAWPCHLVRQTPSPMQKLQKKRQKENTKKGPFSTDNALASLMEVGVAIRRSSLALPWDAGVFGQECAFPLSLDIQDIAEVVQGDEYLNITVIHVWELYLSSLCSHDDVYGFIDPNLTFDGAHSRKEIQSYISNALEDEGKKIYLAPYYHDRHWQLLVISVEEDLALWFCSMHRKPNKIFVDIVNGAYATYQMLIGRASHRAHKLSWKQLKCNKQVGGYECGYYVMQWMSSIVQGGIQTGWDTFFMDTSPFNSDAIDFIRNTWAKYVIELYNKTLG